MGQDQLIKAIEEESRRETERLVKEGESDAEQIVREAQEVVKMDKLERIEGFKKELGRQRSAAVNRARAEARSRLHVESSGLIGEVFEGIVKRFEVLGEKQRREIVKCLFAELKKEWMEDRGNTGNKPRVHIHPEYQSLVKDTEVELVPDEAVSLGVVFFSSDERVRVDNTVSSRLAMARKGLLPHLNRILFD